MEDQVSFRDFDQKIGQDFDRRIGHNFDRKSSHDFDRRICLIFLTELKKCSARDHLARGGLVGRALRAIGRRTQSGKVPHFDQFHKWNFGFPWYNLLVHP